MKTGFLTLDKPRGARSTWCVERVRRILGRGAKVGHGGTLDSSASGLLVILLGGATRLSSLVMLMPKTYRARIALGSETTTCDASGEVTARADWRFTDEAAIERALPAFLGWRMQVPPQISAVHVNGRRAHEVVRSGGEPMIEPRPVFVEKIDRVSPLAEDGTFTLSIRCGKGTYVRGIASDLGRSLGCGAHIAALSRERVGPMLREGAYAPDDEFSVSKDELLSMVKSLDIMERFLPCYRLPEGDMAKLASGQGVWAARSSRTSAGEMSPEGIVMARSKDLLSVCRAQRREGRLFLVPGTNVGTEEF